MAENQPQDADPVRRQTWHEGWDQVVNRGQNEFLRCYCGEEVACYHVECLAMKPEHSDGPDHEPDNPQGVWCCDTHRNEFNARQAARTDRREAPE